MKGIDLFINQATLFADFDDFFRSAPGVYLEKVYGELEFHPEAKSGLLKVSVSKSGKFIISESCYYDFEVDGDPIGYIYPASAWKLARCPLDRSQHGVVMSRSGVVMSYIELGRKIQDRLKTGEYEIHTPQDDHERITESHQLATSSVAERNESVHETYQILKTKPDEPYYWSNGHMIPEFFDDVAYLNRINVEGSFKFNPWIVGSENNDIAIQRMMNGDEISRHSDTIPNGTDRHILYTIHWVTEGDFIGRELIVGKRTRGDLIRYIDSCLNEQDNFSGYCSVPQEFQDTITIKPENCRGAILNAFNPIYYHGVAEMKIGAPVYTISDHFKLPL
jgi:hypothetical protein